MPACYSITSDFNAVNADVSTAWCYYYYIINLCIIHSFVVACNCTLADAAQFAHLLACIVIIITIIIIIIILFIVG